MTKLSYDVVFVDGSSVVIDAHGFNSVLSQVSVMGREQLASITLRKETADPITVGGYKIHLPWWAPIVNDDGTWYINQYHRDSERTLHRQTIADGLSEEDVNWTMGRIKGHFASM